MISKAFIQSDGPVDLDLAGLGPLELAVLRNLVATVQDPASSACA